MKICESIELIHEGVFAISKAWGAIRTQVHDAIRQAEWPIGRGEFIIYPESGKKTGKGNGVVPIKAKPMELLKDDGWTLEYAWKVTKSSDVDTGGRKGSRVGKIDAAKQFNQGLVVVEWETGNISSSHRAINKMALGLLEKKCVAGILVVPTIRLSKFLTDRVGNIEELRPYFPVWQALNVKEGILEIVVIEQDGESLDVPKIPKGKDGRANEGILNALNKSKTAAKSKKPAKRRKKI